MKQAATLALVLVAGCATAGGARPGEDAPRPRPDLVPVSRALTAIEAAERRAEIAAERQRWTKAAAEAPRDPVPRFLAIAAEPPGDERWEEFKALSREVPDSALGQLGMARAYLEWNTLDQVDRAVALALDVEPDEWLAVLVRAQVSERRGRLDAAAADYRTVLGADPQSPEAHLGLARIARAQGDLEKAQAEAGAALKAVPGLFEAYAVLGELAQKAGDAQAAADLWEGAVEAAPRDRAARVTLAKLYAGKGDFARAKDQWRVAVQLREDAAALTALAQAARAAGDATTEAAALERLSAIEPSAAEWKRIAEIRLASGDLEGAEKALQRALARDPKDDAANLGLANVHLARGETQDAVESLRAAGEPGRPALAGLSERLHLERVSRPDVGGLQRAVQTLVDRTYRARQAQNASLSGNLRLRVTVDGSGAATVVEVLEDSVHDGDVRACAYWNLRDAAYPPNKPGRYSFAFAFRR